VERWPEPPRCKSAIIGGGIGDQSPAAITLAATVRLHSWQPGSWQLFGYTTAG
jgi:hypothetical protein